jgi:hypothetical protein
VVPCQEARHALTVLLLELHADRLVLFILVEHEPCAGRNSVSIAPSIENQAAVLIAFGVVESHYGRRISAAYQDLAVCDGRGKALDAAKNHGRLSARLDHVDAFDFDFFKPDFFGCPLRAHEDQSHQHHRRDSDIDFEKTKFLEQFSVHNNSFSQFSIGINLRN